MAILNNLLVKSSSRFIGTSYFQDVSISSLSLSGDLSVTGTSTLTGHVSIGGYNNASYGLSASSAIINSWIRTTGSTGWYNESHGGGWYMTDNDYVRSYGKPVMMGHNMFFGSTSYYVHTNGAANFSTVSSSAANIATLNATNVNVTNNLRANHYDLQTVAQLGGSFYVSPTVKFPNSDTTLKVEKSGSTLTLTITDSSITSTTMAGVVWSANSRVKVSGTINGVVTGTMDGTVSSINTSSHTLTLSVSGENSASVVAGTYTASQFSDLTVMIYQRRDGSNDYRVGIWMNCYDVANSSSTIRIYGGSDANPNVMLGNLTSAGLGTVNNLTPTGWGLFAQNAFLHGKVVANGGLIGNWTIGTTGMYYNSDAPGSTSITMIPGGTAASTTSIGGSSGSKQWIFTGKNLFGIDTTGKLYASSAEISGKITANSGSIAGWRIESTYLASGTATAPAANVLLLSPAGTSSSYTVAGTAKSGWMITAGTTFGVNKDGGVYATSGKIGGWTIGVSSLYNVTDSLTSTSAGIYLGTDGIYNYKDSNTYVKVTNGVITAKAVDLTGKITATSGAIGGFDITATAIKTKDVAVTSNADNSISLSSADFTRTISGTSRAGLRFAIGDKFGVTGDGIIYASSAHISGTLTAGNGSKIGDLTIADGKLSVPAANITGTLSADHIDASSLQIGQTQVTGLSTALGNKADNTTVTALSNKVTAVYGTSNPSSTNASEQVKVVTCSNFELFSGALITVKFTYANAYASGAVQLNVNSKGAKNIWVANAVTSSTNKLLWGAGAVITFRYDGSAFIVVGEPREWYGTCSTAAGTSGKVSTDVAGCVICKGAVVSLSMTNDNTATSPSLNIVYTGSINLYAGNGTTRPTTANGFGWTAGSTVPFVFDGQYWRVGDTASLSRASDAAKTATNYISTIGNTGIKVSYATNSTNYLQITADGTSIYKNSVQVANYGDSIILGKLAADTTHVEIDSDSFDVCFGATTGANSTKLATFGETVVLGANNDAQLSINESEIIMTNNYFNANDYFGSADIFTVKTTIPDVRTYEAAGLVFEYYPPDEVFDTQKATIEIQGNYIKGVGQDVYLVLLDKTNNWAEYSRVKLSTNYYTSGYDTSKAYVIINNDGINFINNTMSQTVAQHAYIDFAHIAFNVTLQDTPLTTMNIIGDLNVSGRFDENTVTTIGGRITCEEIANGDGTTLGAISHIGSIIMSTTLRTMDEVIAIYGGEYWIQHSGYFLYGATSGVTADFNTKDGGYDSVKLTADQSGVGSHGHSVNMKRTNITVNSSGNTMLLCHSSNGGTAVTEANASGYVGHTSKAASAAHTNMPPFKNVYIWERTA